jgi:hypothetical protein
VSTSTTTRTSAKVILDSISPDGTRLVTVEATFHRFILAELNTHRVFSRNAASSRAIPVERMLQRVTDDPAMPVKWGMNQAGMQAGDELTGSNLDNAATEWILARNDAVKHAHYLGTLFSLHKQWTNRLIEPWQWCTDIITTTDFDNMFWQRCHKDAQPEFKALADAIQLAYYRSEPTPLQPGEWHLPYIKDVDWDDAGKMQDGNQLEILKQVSVARCARVSYLNHDGQRALPGDLRLFNFLRGSGHWSPFEHVATPCDHQALIDNLHKSFGEHSPIAAVCKLTGNFRRGFHQYRKDFKDENRTRFIPNLPELQDVAERLRIQYGVK